MQDEEQNKNDVYPDANIGPLGENKADYARPRKFAGKKDGDMQTKIIIIGTIVTTVFAAFLIAFMVTKGQGSGF